MGWEGARSRPGGRRGRVARGGGCGYWSVAVLRATAFFAAGVASWLAAFFTSVFFVAVLATLAGVWAAVLSVFLAGAFDATFAVFFAAVFAGALRAAAFFGTTL